MMNKKAYNTVLLVCVVLFFITLACAPVYIPNVVHVPLLTNKNELHASVNTGISGFDPQIAYAITDNLGVVINGSFANSKSDSSASFHTHNFVETGVGYYSVIDTRVRFEVFGGGGYGRVSSNYQGTFWNTFHDVSLARFFVQPAVGITGKYGDVSFASRCVFVSFYRELKESRAVFLEPVVTFKFGYEYVKAMMQFGFSYPMNAPLTFDYQPFIFSIGLQTTFNRSLE